MHTSLADLRAHLFIQMRETKKTLDAMEALDSTASEMQGNLEVIQHGVGKALTNYWTFPKRSNHLRAVRLNLMDLLPVEGVCGLEDQHNALDQVLLQTCLTVWNLVVEYSMVHSDLIAYNEIVICCIMFVQVVYMTWDSVTLDDLSVASRLLPRWIAITFHAELTLSTLKVSGVV